jgi:hypothetical protein
MQVTKLFTTVPANRELKLRLPKSIKPGNIELLILHDSVTKETEPNEIDLDSVGIDQKRAAKLRSALASFKDWEEPEMDVYNDYDTAKAKL